jgi:hypothetical protein
MDASIVGPSLARHYLSLVLLASLTAVAVPFSVSSAASLSMRRSFLIVARNIGNIGDSDYVLSAQIVIQQHAVS